MPCCSLLSRLFDRDGDSMSTDIYIPMEIVLSHPGQFQFKAELNGDVVQARLTLQEAEPGKVDWDSIQNEFTPLLMCKFGAREIWRIVEVFDHDLHISVGGSFRDWLVIWLDDHGHKYTHITGD